MKMRIFNIVALGLLFLASASAQAQPLTPTEQAVLNLTNQQRQAAGLAPLVANAELMQAARNHAFNMAQQQHMSHVLNGQSPQDRVLAAGFAGMYTGENIAFGMTTPQQVINVWMNSPKHRANILNPQSNEIGIGVVKDGDGFLYWAQDFGRGNGVLPTPVPTPPGPFPPVPVPNPPAEVVHTLHAVNIGHLAFSDSFDTVRKQSHRKVYVTHLQAGKHYVFELNSTQFDTFLRLEKTPGVPLVSNDDGGPGLNSKIVFTPTHSGQYRVIATSFKAGVTGNFTLRFHTNPSNPGNPVLLGTLNPTSPKDASNRRFQIFTRFLEAGKTYTIRVNSPAFDAMLTVKNGLGQVVAFDDDFKGSLNPQLTYTPGASGNYQLIVTSFQPNKVGTFTVTINP